MVLDLRHIPFSRFGSYLSVKHLAGGRAPDRGAGIYLRNHHGGHNALLRIVPLVDDPPMPVATYTTLCWDVPGGGSIELALTDADGVRMRGRGAALRLEPTHPVFVYSTAPGSVTFNMRPRLRHYRLECLRGQLLLDPAAPERPHVNVDVAIHPDAEGVWEIAIDEFDSTWQGRERQSFDAVRVAAENEFAAWVDDTPPAPETFAAARELAAYITWSTVVHPSGLLKRPSMLMSKNWMTNVWSWDHCFNALALARTRPGLALDQMLTVADHQDEFGCYPDAVNDVSMHYNYAKPPIHGWAMRELVRRAGEGVDSEAIHTLYESLSRQYLWWMNHRRLEGRSLPHYLHGNDSGWDNGTMFDRGVPVVAPDLATFLAVQAEVLAEMALDAEQKRLWEKRSAELVANLIEQLWNGERFTARLGMSGEVIATDSLLYCMPIMLGERLPAGICERLICNIERFLTEWGLATEHPESECYRSDGYWRGPIWAPSTCLIVWGVERSGRPDLADEIAKRFCRMCARQGFAENFDALTGEGLCDRAYSWTASVFLLMAERLTKR